MFARTTPRAPSEKAIDSGQDSAVKPTPGQTIDVKMSKGARNPPQHPIQRKRTMTMTTTMMMTTLTMMPIVIVTY
eukprot:506840-Prorocentrum_minimum.AAC.2